MMDTSESLSAISDQVDLLSPSNSVENAYKISGSLTVAVDAALNIDATVAPPGGITGKTLSPELALLNGGPRKVHDSEQRSQSSSGASAAGNSAAGEKKKRRPRRGRRRRWKPYYKLSYEEKRQLEQREERRAETARAKNFAHGRAMAPYNTTQFIMEDREARNLEPDVDQLMESLQHRADSRERTLSGTGSFDSEMAGPSGSETGGSSEGAESFEREFEAEYESAHAERLDGMSKEDLIREYVSLENEAQRSQEEKKDLREMVQRLRQENHQLRKRLAESGLLARSASAPLTNESATEDRVSPTKTSETK